PNDYSNDYPNDFPNESEPDASEFYGSRPQPREQQFPAKFRDNLGQRGWARERQFPGFPGRGGWNEPRGPPGSRRLPSLFSHNILPEPGAFPAFRGFPGNFRGMKRMRRGWKAWDAEFRPQRKRLRRDSFGKKRKQPSGSEEKNPKTDGSDNSSSEN
ncbi:AKP8L protein, partial [Picathartes gymnocephalus]|nr:AKP8L protein [Picathartes gymnocephalus]